MKTISVPLQAKSYPIWIENELLKKIPELLRPMNRGQTWVIFSQDEIYQKHGYAMHEALKSADYKVEFIPLPNGEEAKSFPAGGVIRTFGIVTKLLLGKSSAYLRFPVSIDCDAPEKTWCKLSNPRDLFVNEGAILHSERINGGLYKPRVK